MWLRYFPTVAITLPCYCNILWDEQFPKFICHSGQFLLRPSQTGTYSYFIFGYTLNYTLNIPISFILVSVSLWGIRDHMDPGDNRPSSSQWRCWGLQKSSHTNTKSLPGDLLPTADPLRCACSATCSDSKHTSVYFHVILLSATCQNVQIQFLEECLHNKSFVPQ